jgi:hypothetical protein
MSDRTFAASITTHLDQAVRAAAAHDDFLVPIELASVLALGGEEGIDAATVQWLALLKKRRPELSAAERLLCNTVSVTYHFDETITDLALDLLAAHPEHPQRDQRWRELELGERTQLLVLLAHVVAARLGEAERPAR